MWLQFYQTLQPEKITDKFLWGRLEPLLGYLTDEQKSTVLEALHLAYDSHHGQVGAHACGIMLCHEVSQSQHWFGCGPHAVHGFACQHRLQAVLPVLLLPPRRHRQLLVRC